MYRPTRVTFGDWKKQMVRGFRKGKGKPVRVRFNLKKFPREVRVCLMVKADEAMPLGVSLKDGKIGLPIYLGRIRSKKEIDKALKSFCRMYRLPYRGSEWQEID